MVEGARVSKELFKSIQPQTDTDTPWPDTPRGDGPDVLVSVGVCIGLNALSLLPLPTKKHMEVAH